MRRLRRTRVAHDEAGCGLAREPLRPLQAFARNEHAGRCAARLADVAKARRHASRNGVCEVRVRQDDVGRFAAEFLRHALDRWARRLVPPARRPGGTRDRDHVHIRVRGHRGAHLRPVAVDEVEHTRGDAGVVHHLREQSALSGDSSLGLRTTVHPAASAGPAFGADLVERPVPGRDESRTRRWLRARWRCRRDG